MKRKITFDIGPHPDINLIHGDCLEEMKNIPDGSIDLILTDPPYGTTACKWDSIIPFEPMWIQLKRIIKLNGAIVLFGSEPFSSFLRISNIEMYKYDWVWEKTNCTGFLDARRKPLKAHENIIIFAKKNTVYNPQKTMGKPYTQKAGKREFSQTADPKIRNGGHVTVSDGMRFPKSVILFKNGEKGLHPTQKPVALCEYLIKTYTNENETVLDFTMGSFTTAIACLNTKRSFIGIEKDEHYFQVGKERLEKHLLTLDYTPEVIYNQV